MLHTPTPVCGASSPLVQCLSCSALATGWRGLKLVKEGGCVVAVLCRLCAEQQCITPRLVCLICTSCVWLPELPQHDRRMVADAGPRRPFIVNLSPWWGRPTGLKVYRRVRLTGPRASAVRAWSWRTAASRYVRCGPTQTLHRKPFPLVGSAYGPKGLSKGPLDGPTC